MGCLVIEFHVGNCWFVAVCKPDPAARDSGDEKRLECVPEGTNVSILISLVTNALCRTYETAI